VYAAYEIAALRDDVAIESNRQLDAMLKENGATVYRPKYIFRQPQDSKGSLVGGDGVFGRQFVPNKARPFSHVHQFNCSNKVAASCSKVLPESYSLSNLSSF
jgi:hypothetical protein